MRRLLCSIALVSALLSSACVESAATSPDTQSENDQTGSLGTFTSDASGFDTHSFYYDTGKEVVVFDAQFTTELAEDLIADIQAKTTSTIAYVVITHPNPDKFNGAPAFQAIGAKVVASEATAQAIPMVHAYKKAYFVDVAKMFTEDTYPAEATVDITFSGDYDLPLAGGAQVKLSELASSGVSSTQTVAFVPELDALLVGDLVHHKAHAWLEGGIVGGAPKPDLGAWKSALTELDAYPGATVYGGRGEPAPVDEAIADETEYLTAAEQIVTDYVNGLGPDAMSELSGPNAGTHAKNMADLAAAAYPEYAYPYLFEYSVYALAGKIAATSE